MLFHDVQLSYDQVLQGIADALTHDDALVYLDASLLIHCYEVGSSARDELLAALDGLGERVIIPLWAARETWKRSFDPDLGRTPLKSPASKLDNQLKTFVSTTRGFVDEDMFGQSGVMTRADYLTRLEAAKVELLELTKLASKHERKPVETSKRLIPFINDRILQSDLKAILIRVSAEGETRFTHKVPPGWLDGGGPGTDGETKGKKENRYGDLIIWMEILAHIQAKQPKHLVLITRDVKKDWVYTPQTLLDAAGRPVQNLTVTLPDPLLIYEAKGVCTALESVHIVSLDAFATVLNNKLATPVPRLLAAVQLDDVTGPRLPKGSTGAPPTEADVRFTPEDLGYEPQRGDPLDDILVSLTVPDFKVQNRAVERLPEEIDGARREQQISLGLRLARAAAAGAREPSDYLVDVLQDSDAPGDLRRHLLLGALAGVYLTDQAELRKPTADEPLTATLFRLTADPILGPAYAPVIARTAGQRKQYLALPTDAPSQIALEFLIARDDTGATLRGVLVADGARLIEDNAPESRRISSLGETTTVEQVLERIALEFCVPRALLTTDETTTRFRLPPTLGFIRWGPGTGIDLR